MEQTYPYYPYYDGDIQAKVKEDLGEDKILVFNYETGRIYLAQTINGRFLIDVGSNAQIKSTVEEMEEGNWQLKTS